MDQLTHEDRRKRRRDMSQHVKDGKSVVQAAQKWKVTTATIEAACRENRVPFDRFTGKSDVVLRIVAMLCVGDRSLAGIGREAYVSREYTRQVLQRCKALGLPVADRYQNQ